MARKGIKAEIGRVYGSWTVLSEASRRRRVAYFVCRCKCKKIKEVRENALTSSKSLACGSCRKAFTKHGLSTTREYKSWDGMIRRCSDKRRINYKYYGGRGIRVEKRWLVFDIFLKDMGLRPEGKTLDRIDCNSNYGPKKCKWSTPKEQAMNRRNSIKT